MPEIISDHPDLVISVLKSANMKCAAVVKPNIIISAVFAVKIYLKILFDCNLWCLSESYSG